MWWCVVLTACAVELWSPSGRRLAEIRLNLPQGTWRRPTIPSWLPAVLVAAVLVVVLDGPATVVALAGCGAMAVAVRQWRTGRRRSRAERQRRDIVEALSFLVAELRAGAVPEVALASVAKEVPLLEPAARAAARGVKISPLLREVAAEPGCEALVHLGAGWQVAESSGAPLADALARIVDRVRDDLDVLRDVEAELAPARATARIMALLPIVGLGLGAGIGGDPIGIVLNTWPGAVSAGVGVALACLGILWIERVAGSVPR